MAGRIGLEGRQVDDGQVRHEARQLAAVGADQQVADEQRVPGELGEDPRPDPVGSDRRRRRGPGRTAPCLPRGPGNPAAGSSNCSGVIDPLLSHQTASSVVASRTTNLSLGERPVWTPVSARSAPPWMSLVSPRIEGLLVEGGRLEVPENALEIAEAEGLGALRAVEDADIVHGKPLLIVPHRATLTCPDMALHCSCSSGAVRPSSLAASRGMVGSAGVTVN